MLKEFDIYTCVFKGNCVSKRTYVKCVSDCCLWMVYKCSNKSNTQHVTGWMVCGCLNGLIVSKKRVVFVT